MDQDRNTSEWYRSENGGWYRPAAAPEAPIPEKKPKKKHTGMKVTMIVVCVLVLITATALIFSDDYRQTPGSPSISATPQPTPSSLPVSPEDVWNEFFGSGDSGGYQFDEDFRDFFDNFYVADDSLQGSNIQQAGTGSGVTMELVSSRGREELTLQEVYAKCIDSTVGIKATVNGNTMSYSWGTGIVMTSDGYILTNAHVIEGADEAFVILSDGSEYAAKLVGEDPQTDVAVLKVRAAGLTPAEFGVSDELMVGDQVVAIGNPLGSELSGTMTNGIVSAINRNVSYDGRTLTLLQTNAALNEGNSGGPLINMYGQVIGITNMKMAASYTEVTIEGIGFAIPTSFAKTIVDQLIDGGEVSGRPGMGITVGAIPAEAAEHYDLPEGLYILSVSEGSDAEKQGIRSGDVLTHVNGIQVLTTQDVLDIRDQYGVGDTLTLTIFRDGVSFDVQIELYDINKLY